MNYYRCSMGSDAAEEYTYTVNSVPAILNATNYFSANLNLTNESFIIGSQVTGAYNMFAFCNYFNGSVKLGANITNCRNMFWYCNLFNQPVSIPANVTDCCNMFQWANYLNQSVTFQGNNYNNLNCYGMLNGCRNFNQPFVIPEGAYNCKNMFQNTKFNQAIYIPASANDCALMFYNSPMCKNIFVNGNIEKTSLSSAITKSNNQILNVFYNGYGNFFNSQLRFILGTTLTWSNIDGLNGYYNETYNVYCYNNYYPE